MSVSDISQFEFPPQTALGKMPKQAREALNAVWRTNSYNNGEFIIGEDEDQTDICFLLKGTARVSIFTATGRELSVQGISEGDCFGEFSAIDGSPRSANIEATSPCVAARLTGPEFRTLLQSTPELAMTFLQLLVAKLRGMTHTISDLSELTASQRIGFAVLDMAKKASNGQNYARVDRPPTQSEMAARLFSNREAVAREMGRMKRKGVISRDGRAILVPNIENLEDYVESEGAD